MKTIFSAIFCACLLTLVSCSGPRIVYSVDAEASGTINQQSEEYPPQNTQPSNCGNQSRCYPYQTSAGPYRTTPSNNNWGASQNGYEQQQGPPVQYSDNSNGGNSQRTTIYKQRTSRSSNTRNSTTRRK
ncbi:MAG: hypothetical protein RL641_782 [Candidatus Parcubacteria bacterium]|jgi:hypothetical protein